LSAGLLALRHLSGEKVNALGADVDAGRAREHGKHFALMLAAEATANAGRRGLALPICGNVAAYSFVAGDDLRMIAHGKLYLGSGPPFVGKFMGQAR